MGILAWIVIGGLSGWLASIIVRRKGMGCILDIVAGIIGALIGGLIFSYFGSKGITGFNIWSFFVAFVGAVIILGIISLFRKR